MLDVDIQTVPSLSERAKAAYEAAREVAKEKERAIYDALRAHFWEFATETLEIDAGTLACARWEETRQSKSPSVRHPSEPPKDQAIMVYVEGLVFRTIYSDEVVERIGTSHKDTYVDIVEREFRVQLKNVNPMDEDDGYKLVTDLATVGRRL